MGSVYTIGFQRNMVQYPRCFDNDLQADLETPFYLSWNPVKYYLSWNPVLLYRPRFQDYMSWNQVLSSQNPVLPVLESTPTCESCSAYVLNSSPTCSGIQVSTLVLLPFRLMVWKYDTWVGS